MAIEYTIDVYLLELNCIQVSLHMLFLFINEWNSHKSIQYCFVIQMCVDTTHIWTWLQVSQHNFLMVLDNWPQLNVQTKQVEPLVEGGAQIQQVLNIECLTDFSDAPLLNIKFR